MSNNPALDAVVQGMIKSRERGAPLSSLVVSPHFASLGVEDKKTAIAAYLAANAGKERTWSDTLRDVKKGGGDGLMMAGIPLTMGAAAMFPKEMVRRGLTGAVKKMILNPGAAAVIPSIALTAGGIGAARQILTSRRKDAGARKMEETLSEAIKNNDDGKLMSYMMSPTSTAPGFKERIVQAYQNHLNNQFVMEQYGAMLDDYEHFNPMAPGPITSVPLNEDED